MLSRGNWKRKKNPIDDQSVHLSNLTIRIFVAVVAIPLILLLTLAGGFYFFGLIALISAVGVHEFYSLARAKGTFPQVGLGIVFSVALSAVFFHQRLQYLIPEWLQSFGISVSFPTQAQAVLILLLLFVPSVMLSELYRHSGSAILNIASTVLGLCYVSFFLGTLVALREVFIPGDFPVFRFFDTGQLNSPEVRSTIYEWGGWTIVALFASIWLCDSAAYFAGRAFGKRKLFERISPKKTWEGAIAGFIAAIFAFWLARELVMPYLSFTNAIVCGFIVGVFGQMGDLVESMLKRDAGVKDSSSLIPGHGGVLDRFDSLLFAAPLLFCYLDFVVFT